MLQYEELSEAMANGHLYVDNNDIDPKLLAMENPYDRNERERLDVSYLWDHAFYNGHYYVYFGVVPEIMFFLPFRLITGQTLPAYHVTQIYSVLVILGFFLLFYEIRKKYFEKLPFIVYLFLSATFSVISIWYAMDAPAMYCTAITAGISMELFSLFFFFRAVYVETEYKKQIRLAFFGALFGALTIGCRPTIALANLVVLPMLFTFLKKHKVNKQLIRDLFFDVIPYIVTIVLIGIYNYVRFDSPFEFGQSYQLTLGDQSNYNSGGFGVAAELILPSLFKVFFEPLTIGFPNNTPSLNFAGIFFEFPILFFSFFLFFPQVSKKYKEMGIRNVIIMLFILPIIIAFAMVKWSPVILERYKLDLYYLTSISSFFAIGTIFSFIKNKKGKTAFLIFMILFCLYNLLMALLLFLNPHDLNWTAEDPERLRSFWRTLMFWKY